MIRTMVCVFLLLNSAGCSSILHELQPHRLRRLNYQEPRGRTDGVYFSVEDRLDVRPTADTDCENLSTSAQDTSAHGTSDK